MSRGSPVAGFVLSLVVLAVATTMTKSVMAQVLPGSPFGASDSAFSGGTVSTPILFPSGTVTAPSIAWSADADGTGTGLYRFGANIISFAANGADQVAITTNLFRLPSGGTLCWSSSTGSSGTSDTCFGRQVAGVLRFGGSITAIAGLIGGGSAVASATALPLPTGRVFHVTGTTTVTSITSTNFASGAVITLIFDGILTFTDGNNIAIAGNFVTSADDTITLAFDGTNWYEIARAVN